MLGKPLLGEGGCSQEDFITVSKRRGISLEMWLVEK